MTIERKQTNKQKRKQTKKQTNKKENKQTNKQKSKHLKFSLNKKNHNMFLISGFHIYFYIFVF
jgi:hypothetical protein